MAKKYEEEFKLKIVGLHNSGKSVKDITDEYEISRSTVNNWIKKYSSNDCQDEVVPSSLCPVQSEKNNMKFYKLKAYKKNASSGGSFGVPFNLELKREISSIITKSGSLKDYSNKITCEKFNYKGNAEVKNLSDINIGTDFLIDEFTKEFFENNFKENIEYIPIICTSDNITRYLLYPLDVVDAYDYDNMSFSTSKTIPSPENPVQTEFITCIEKAAFKKEKLEDISIFRCKIVNKFVLNDKNWEELEDDRVIYVNETAKKILQKNKLTGFFFEEVEVN